MKTSVQRSLVNFLILAIFAAGTALFVLHKANEAIVEITKLSEMPVYLGTRHINNR